MRISRPGIGPRGARLGDQTPRLAKPKGTSMFPAGARRPRRGLAAAARFPMREYAESKFQITAAMARSAVVQARRRSVAQAAVREGGMGGAQRPPSPPTRTEVGSVGARAAERARGTEPASEWV